MAISIRRGIRDDAAFIGWVMLAASRGHRPLGVWDVMIGLDEAGCLDYLTRLARSEPRSLCHYESYLVAEVDGRPAAALCGFATSDGGWVTVGDAAANVTRDLKFTPEHQARTQQRSAAIWTCFMPDAADWAVENVATLPQYRRRGLVDALMSRMLDEGRKRGCRRAQITIFIGNDPAQKAYEKAGFKVSDERRNADFEALLGTPGFRRLTRAL